MKREKQTTQKHVFHYYAIKILQLFEKKSKIMFSACAQCKQRVISQVQIFIYKKQF